MDSLSLFPAEEKPRQEVRNKAREVVHVVVPRPLPGLLSYRLPEELQEKVQFGSLVHVPFRSGVSHAFVVGFGPVDTPELKGVALKDVKDAPFELSLFSEKDYEFFRWVADYYQLPLGEVFHSAFPKPVLKNLKRGAAAGAPTDAAGQAPFQSTQPLVELTADQTTAMQAISAGLRSEAFRSFLLFGVTGSGKTEIYIRAAELAASMNKSALILVPEIALTPQLRKRFEDRFGDTVAVLHSSLGEKTRREFWWDILRGTRKVVVGARSAVFAPLREIGLIVVDEEHEPSYKQEDRLRYNARDLALVRARQHQAIAILGSATPSVETFYAAEMGKHELLRLRERPGTSQLPSIEIVDLKGESVGTRGPGSPEGRILLGQRMREVLTETLARGEQAMVFVNRKGFASFLLCGDCGEVPKCLNCSVSLTYYQRSRQLRCHYCGLQMTAIDSCTKCQSINIKYMGLGTELVEDEIRTAFPEFKVGRLDADTADTARKIEDILEGFRRGETQVLVGTQMLAKGHDFPNVTFVGVVMADINLHLPDFRAGERTFQLLAQVAGRAGRAEKPGRVIIQTLLPDHYVIQAASAQDYLAFYRSEIESRQQFGYPPFSRMAKLEFRNTKEPGARAEAERAGRLLDHLGPEARGFMRLGPAPASVARVANQYRWQILLKSEKTSALNAVIKTLRKEGLRYIDVDPVSTL